MLEVQLCRRSRLGAVIPIARSDSDDLVRLVAAYMRAKLETIQLADPLLAEFVADERKRLQQHLLAEGIDCIPEVAIHA